MNGERLRIGELLIEAGVLNHGKLRQALELQRETPRPLGEILVSAGMVTEPQLIQALSRQLAIPWVSLWHVDPPQDLMNMLTREEAEQYRMLPIYVRTAVEEPPSLFVALDDPTNQGALEFMEARAGMPVKPMLAGPTDLSNAIRALYAEEGEEEEEEEEEEAPPIVAPRRASSPPPPPPPRRKAAAPPVAAEAAQAGVSAPRGQVTAADAASIDAPASVEEGIPQEAPPPEVAIESTLAEIEHPADGRARVRPRLRRAIAFTFLDGTTLSLGAGEAGAGAAEEEVSLAGLIAGLRRHADDSTVPAPLGERGAHRLLAALLDVLSRKHLLTEHELTEALREGKK